MEVKKQNKIKLSRLRLQKSSKIVHNSNSEPVSSQISKYFRTERFNTESEPINMNIHSPNVSSSQPIITKACVIKETDNLLLEEYNKIKSNQNNAFENSISDFTVPVKTKLSNNPVFSPMMTRSRKKEPPKTVQKKKAVSKQKFDRKQPKIKKAISMKTKEENKFSNVLNEQCMAEDINPEHLQIAMALSKSMMTESDSENNSESTYFPDTQERLGLIKKTLEQFGFKNSSNENNTRNEGLSLKENKLKKLRWKSVLLKRTPEDRAKLVEQKAAELLSESLPEMNVELVVQTNKIRSTILKEFYKERTIFYLNNLDRNKLSEVKLFYTYLMTPSNVKSGTLLKNWAEIPGRDKSPERINCSSDLKNKSQNFVNQDHLKLTNNKELSLQLTENTNITILDILNIEEKSLDSTSIQNGTSFAKVAKKRSPRKLAKARKLGLSLIRSNSESSFEKHEGKHNVLNTAQLNTSLNSSKRTTFANLDFSDISLNKTNTELCEESTNTHVANFISASDEPRDHCTYLNNISYANITNDSSNNVTVNDDDGANNLNEISNNSKNITQQFLTPIITSQPRNVSPDIFAESFECAYNNIESPNNVNLNIKDSLLNENIVPPPAESEICDLTQNTDLVQTDVVLDLTQSSDSDICDDISHITSSSAKVDHTKTNVKISKLNNSQKKNKVDFGIFNGFSSDEDILESSNGICHFENFSKSTTSSEASFKSNNHSLEISKDSFGNSKVNLHDNTTFKTSNVGLTTSQMEQIILLSNKTVSSPISPTAEVKKYIENILRSPVAENSENLVEPKKRNYCRNIFRKKMLTDSICTGKTDSLHEKESEEMECDLIAGINIHNYSPIFKEEASNMTLSHNSAKKKKSVLKSTKSFESTFNCKKKSHSPVLNKSNHSFTRKNSFLKESKSSDDEFDFNVNKSYDKSLSTSSDSLLVISDEELNYSASTPYKKTNNNLKIDFKRRLSTAKDCKNIYAISSDSEDEKLQALKQSLNRNNKKMDWNYKWSTDDESNDSISHANTDLVSENISTKITNIAASTKYHQISTDFDNSAEESLCNNLLGIEDNKDAHYSSNESDAEDNINKLSAKVLHVISSDSDSDSVTKKEQTFESDIISTPRCKEKRDISSLSDNNLSSYDEMKQYFPTESDEEVSRDKSKRDNTLNKNTTYPKKYSPFQDSFEVPVDLTRLENNIIINNSLRQKPKPRRITELQEIKTPNKSKIPFLDESLNNLAEGDFVNIDEDQIYNLNTLPECAHGRTKTISRNSTGGNSSELNLNDDCSILTNNEYNEVFSPPASKSAFEEIESKHTEGVCTPRNSKNFQTVENDRYMYRTKNITPKPDYERMDTPQRLKELHKYGLKPLKRARANKMLEYIYNQTHPLAEIQLDEMESSSKRRKVSEYEVVDDEVNCNKSEANQETSSNYEELAINTNDIDRSTNVLLQNGFNCANNDEEVILPTKWTKGKIASCMVPLHLSFFNLVSSTPELREAILRYEPIDLDDLHAQLKDLGYRYDSKDLISFLDKRCITVKMKDRFRKEKKMKTTQSSKHKSKKQQSKQTAMCLETVDLDLDFPDTQNPNPDSQRTRDKVLSTHCSLDLSRNKHSNKMVNLRKVKSVELCFKPISDSESD